MRKMKCPVVKLEKALYGHKNSGAYWQQYCDEKCRNAGFTPISENWPCVYWSEELELLLIVYVDDMKLSGKTKNMPEAWKRLGEGINLVQPPGDGEGVLNFLGTEHRTKTCMRGGVAVRTMEWDCVAPLRRCVSKYEEAVRSVVGMYPRMSKADTPLLHEETRTSPHRRPATDEDFYECPSCIDTFPASFMQQQCYHKAGVARRLKEIRPPLTKPSFATADSALEGGSGMINYAGSTSIYEEYNHSNLLAGLAGVVNRAGVESPAGADNYDDVREWLAGMGDFELSHLDEVMEDLSVSSSPPSARKGFASLIASTNCGLHRRRTLLAARQQRASSAASLL